MRAGVEGKPRTANARLITAGVISGRVQETEMRPALTRQPVGNCDAAGRGAYTSSFVQVALRFEDFTTASMKAMPRTPSSIFG